MSQTQRFWDKWLPTITVALPVFVMIALIGLLIEMSTSLNKIGRENNSYLRTMTCIASVSPAKRTPDYVKDCYSKGEKHNDVTIDRYGDGK